MFGGPLNVNRKGTTLTKAPICGWRLDGRRAIRVMITLYPFLTPKRRAQIRKVLVGWYARRPKSRYKMQCKRGHSHWGVIVVRGKPTRGHYCIPCNREQSRQSYTRRGRRRRPFRDDRQLLIKNNL
jgi:hypothetical protein